MEQELTDSTKKKHRTTSARRAASNELNRPNTMVCLPPAVTKPPLPPDVQHILVRAAAGANVLVVLQRILVRGAVGKSAQRRPRHAGSPRGWDREEEPPRRPGRRRDASAGLAFPIEIEQ